MRSPELMVPQTLMFLFAGIEGPAAARSRLGDAHRGMLAGRGRLTRAGLGAHGR
jgi:hypothetical protein